MDGLGFAFTLHPSPFTLHPSPFTLHPSPFTLHPYDYLVHVSRRGERPRGVLWPILLTQRLPTISIPLLPQDPDADLDLGRVLNRAYDRAGYDMTVDYRQPPRIPLSPPADRWAAEWLQKKLGGVVLC